MIKDTSVVSGHEAREKILSGINKVYHVVAKTLGPSGKNAILPMNYNRGPRNTNDGYTISENVLLKNIHERIAADFFKEGAKKTNEAAGDGTTTTTIVAGHLINKIFKEIPDENIPVAGISRKKDVMTLRREIKEAKEKVIEKIKEKAKKIESLEELEKIAFVAVEDKEASKVVAKMVWELGVDNYVDVTEGYKGEIETEVIRGMRFPAKVPARAFVNKPERHEMVAEEVKVFITNYKLDNPFEIVEILETCKVPKIAIIAPEFGVNTLVSLAKTCQGGLFVYPIAAPGMRSVMLEDLAVYTKATFYDKDKGMRLNSVKVTDLGYAEKIVVKETENREDAILTGGKGDKLVNTESVYSVAARIEMLKKQMQETRTQIEKEQLKRRIANMSSNVGIIKVGAATDAELRYIKLKIEDGVYACKAALEEGYVKGGGLCLKEIAEELEENILTETLKEPHEQIKRNYGGELNISEDVIDPAKVVRLEVEYGTSIASQMITTDILIAELEEESPGEGYKSIAKAINAYAYFIAKEKGLLRESEEEAERDRMKLWEEAMFNDK